MPKKEPSEYVIVWRESATGDGLTFTCGPIAGALRWYELEGKTQAFCHALLEAGRQAIAVTVEADFYPTEGGLVIEAKRKHLLAKVFEWAKFQHQINEFQLRSYHLGAATAEAV